MNARDRLAALLSPPGLPEFFERCYERAPLHLPAGADTAAEPLLTHEALLGALSGQRRVPEGLVAFPEHAGVADTAAILADPALLDAYLAAGHPLVWNRARGLFPEVDALAADMAEAMGAHVWPNVYATGEAGTPFGVHFDTHEVIAVQCEGRKEWTISEVRVDRPVDAVEMEDAVAAAQRSRREEAAARPALRFTVGPGDRVYVPRGQFHAASTPSGRSLHVTFGIRQLTGLDVVRILAADALADPRLRELVPPLCADPDGARAADWLAAVVERLGELLLHEDLARSVAAARRHLVRRSAGGSGRDGG